MKRLAGYYYVYSPSGQIQGRSSKKRIAQRIARVLQPMSSGKLSVSTLGKAKIRLFA